MDFKSFAQRGAPYHERIRLTASALVIDLCPLTSVITCIPQDLKFPSMVCSSIYRMAGNTLTVTRNPDNIPTSRYQSGKEGCTIATLVHNYPEKKFNLINATLKLMLSKGYHATTVDEICSMAGVTKGSYFHYFKSKEDAAKATLEYFGMMQQSLFEDAAFGKVTDPWDRLQRFFDFYLFMADHPDLPKSCLASTFSQELSDDYPVIRTMCADNFSANAQHLHEILKECKERYAPQTEFDPKSAAECFTSLYQGSMILSKAKQDTSIMKQNIEHYRAYLRLLFSK